MGMPASKKRRTEPSKSSIAALTDKPKVQKPKGKVTISTVKPTTSTKKSIKKAKSPSPVPEAAPEVEAASNASDVETGSDAEDAYEDPSDTETLDADSSIALSEAPSSGDEDDEGLGSDSDSDFPTAPTKKRKRRTDPAVFSTSLSKILSSHLTTSARSDPILIRARASKQVESSSNAARVEAKAKRLITLEKKKSLEKGRIRNLLPVTNTAEDDDDVRDGKKEVESMQAIMEREKRLRKIAQRGVVRLFNAVRAAQVKGEMVEKDLEADINDAARVVSLGEKKEKVTEMSKKGFLDLLEKGGK